MRSSRTSLRTGRVIDGKGPAVSEGVTTHVAFDTGGVVVVVGVVAAAAVVVAVGLVGVSPLQADERMAPAALNMPERFAPAQFFQFRVRHFHIPISWPADLSAVALAEVEAQGERGAALLALTLHKWVFAAESDPALRSH